MRVNSVNFNNQENFGGVVQIKKVMYNGKPLERLDSPTGKMLLNQAADVLTGGADLNKVRIASMRILPDYLAKIPAKLMDIILDTARTGKLVLDKASRELLQNEAAVVTVGEGLKTKAFLVTGEKDVSAVKANGLEKFLADKTPAEFKLTAHLLDSSPIIESIKAI